MTAFHEIYQAKLTTPDQAVAEIADGSNLIISMGVSQPPALMAAIAERARTGALSHLPVYYMHGSEAMARTLLLPELMEVIKPRPLFMSSHDRHFSRSGHQEGKKWVDFVPCHFHQAAKLLIQDIGADCFIATVSPMTRSGHFSLGTNADYGCELARAAKRLIVEVNPQMPRVFGDVVIHISEVDAIVENDTPLMELGERPMSPEDEVIGRRIAEMIPDGATIQMGVGGVPGAVMSCLSEHNDLGLHSELFSPPMVELIMKGVLTGANKTLLRHKHVFTLALGSSEMFAFMDNNPGILGLPASFVNDPAVVARNDGMISVNSAIEIDLTGQINSEFLGGREFSGTGGQLDFIRGAYAARGGKSFVALHSTAKGGAVSRIVARLGGPVSDPRMDTHYVVTECGIENVKGKTTPERAEALIRLAHPNFRDQLRWQAVQGGLIPS